MPRHRPEDRRPLPRALDHELVEAQLAHGAHRRGKGADAGDDEAVGRAQRVVVGRQGHPGADALERLLDAAAVAHPVVDDPDARSPRLRRPAIALETEGLRPAALHVKVPLVEGTPVSVGSMATAPRRARAKALNAASIM